MGETHHGDGRTTREAFLSCIRSSLGRAKTMAPTELPPTVDESLARLGSAEEDVVSRFAAEATTVGMQVRRLRGDELGRALLELLRENGAKRVVLGVGSVPQAVGLADAIRRAGLEVVDWRAGGFDCQYDVDVGITDVHAALAETGTLVLCTDRGHGRGLSLVPPIHIAIVRASDILPDMLDYWARLDGIPGRELPSSQAFITGPSKTADIEGQLVTGVHGPAAVHVLLLDDA